MAVPGIFFLPFRRQHRFLLLLIAEIVLRVASSYVPIPLNRVFIRMRKNNFLYTLT
jgi:hypothetical protein